MARALRASGGEFQLQEMVSEEQRCGFDSDESRIRPRDARRSARGAPATDSHPGEARTVRTARGAGGTGATWSARCFTWTADTTPG